MLSVLNNTLLHTNQSDKSIWNTGKCVSIHQRPFPSDEQNAVNAKISEKMRKFESFQNFALYKNGSYVQTKIYSVRLKVNLLS